MGTESQSARDARGIMIRRDDLAVLMDAIARLEQGQEIDGDMVMELSRIASDLAQRADDE